MIFDRWTWSDEVDNAAGRHAVGKVARAVGEAGWSSAQMGVMTEDEHAGGERGPE